MEALYRANKHESVDEELLLRVFKGTKLGSYIDGDRFTHFSLAVFF